VDEMKISRLSVAAAAAVLMIGAAIAAPSPSVADQTWRQAVGRQDADAACPESTLEELAAGWSQWAPSYAMWMNDGTGGWVCERFVTWAVDTPPPSTNAMDGPPGGELEMNCQRVVLTYYVNFGAGWALPNGTDTWFNSSCLGLPDDTISVEGGAGFVYAPDGSAQAAARCAEEWPLYPTPVFNGTYVYDCI
jgi:hypothetical protein